MVGEYEPSSLLKTVHNLCQKKKIALQFAVLYQNDTDLYTRICISLSIKFNFASSKRFGIFALIY